MTTQICVDELSLKSAKLLWPQPVSKQCHYYAGVILYRVPIANLETVRQLLRSAGVKYRIRFRGPRRDKILKFMSGTYRQKAGHTLKADATHFTVYAR